MKVTTIGTTTYKLAYLLNCSKQNSTKFSPYEILFGRKPFQVADVVLNNHVVLNNKKLEKNLELANHRQKKFYDGFVRDNVDFKIADLVLFTNSRSGPDGKFQNVHFNRPVKFKPSRNFQVESEAKKKAVSKPRIEPSIVPNIVNESYEIEYDSASLLSYYGYKQTQDESEWINMSFGDNIGPEDFESSLKRHQTRMGHKLNGRGSCQCVNCPKDHTLMENKAKDASTRQNESHEITRLNKSLLNRKVQRRTLSTSLKNSVPDQQHHSLERIEDEFVNQARCRFCNRDFKGLKGLNQH
ncbi:hypothetical protein BpHYR1_049109 [Brachionus plicatilis]|uniref:Uncharacterized protein n=1 Tax=Brachionus plicatilis TaxID=10195 RepID=A0A3M7QIB8_BRAPC|nr:hypothetical protein BpHYR1_049109 [Brachionus plicatilis]